MAQAPFPKIADFIRRLAPFDTLAEDELLAAVGRMEVAYFPKGRVIIKKGGQASRYLYIIQAGSAKVSVPDESGNEVLLDIRGESDVFGAASLLAGQGALFQVTAQEDLLCYLLPAEPFKELVATKAAFERHFRYSLARNIEAMRRAADRQHEQMTGLAGINLDAALVRSQVREIMSAHVVSCLPSVSVRTAAGLMSERRVGAIVVTDEEHRLRGIFTDRDLRVRVVAAGLGTDKPIGEFMSQPVHVIKPRAFAFEALLEMSTHGTHHLVVVDENNVAVGVVSDHDFQVLAGSSPVGVIRDIEKVATVADLVKLHQEIDRVVEMLLRLGGSAETMLALVTEFNDRLTNKLIELSEEELEEAGLGRPPLPYVWMALGSEGRREQTLRTDQDNALIFATTPPEREAEVKAWFLRFAERVVDGLVRCGFPRCQAEVMASNPKWCQTEEQWRRTFLGWIADPQPLTLRLATIFFDFRAIHAEADFVDGLALRLKEAIQGNRPFLRHLAHNALFNRPPLGFLRQFVVEKSGEHKNKLNLKLSGLTPVVDAARVMALDLGVAKTNTLERLDEIARAGLTPPGLASDVREAFSFIALLRITHHLEARARHETPDNFVDPSTLNNLQRKMLKASFATISQLQELLEYRYQTRTMG